MVRNSDRAETVLYQPSSGGSAGGGGGGEYWNDTSISFLLPAVTPQVGKIKVNNRITSTTFSQDFTIEAKPSVKIIYPIGGEKLIKGQPLTIKWDSQSAPTVMVDLVRPNFEHHLTAPTGDITNNGSFTTIVPIESRVRPGDDYKIKVMYRKNAEIITQSESGPFSIIEVPTGARLSPCNGLGDIDQDGLVTNNDAQIVLKFDLQLDGYKNPTDEQKRRADVNKDGVYDVADSLLIERYRLNYIDTFPACS